MSTRKPKGRFPAGIAAIALTCGTLPAASQVPVDDDGNVVGSYESAESLGDDGVPLRSAAELEALVGPVALYPDDLLAIVLPASTYPLQVVEAARFLEALEMNPELEPEEDWDDSIVALVNYPEVVEMMNEDLDWTWQLGEAVVAQQADVIAAIATFRDMAHAAGNLKSDERQTISRNDDDIIEIEPASEEVIYVPYYEPERVIVYQPQPVYYYYPRAYPVYYYPYPTYYSFSWGYFWGVTTAFTIGWNSHCLNVYHPTFYGHPYYGYSYWNTWWYRRPSVVVYNDHYYDQRHVHNRYEQGDRWRSQGYTRLHHDDQRITRNRYYPNPTTAGTQSVSNRRFATGGDTVRRSAAGFQGDRTQRSSARDDDASAQIRAALNESRAARARTDATPGGRQPTTGQARERNTATGNPGTSTAANTVRHPRAQGTSVREVRDALAASRETRPAPAERSPAVSRPAVPQPRPAVPSPRPTIRTWESAPRASTPAPVAAARRVAPPSTSQPAPSHRAATSSRPTSASTPTTRSENAPSRSSTQRASAQTSGHRGTARPR